MKRRDKRGFRLIRSVAVWPGAMFAVGFVFLQIFAQLYPDEVRGWLDPLLQGRTGIWIAVGVAVVFVVGVVTQAIQQTPDAEDASPALSGTGDLPPVARLDDDLHAFRRREGFVDAARTSEIAALAHMLCEGRTIPS